MIVWRKCEKSLRMEVDLRKGDPVEQMLDPREPHRRSVQELSPGAHRQGRFTLEASASGSIG
jgi:hypothetical protein